MYILEFEVDVEGTLEWLELTRYVSRAQALSMMEYWAEAPGEPEHWRVVEKETGVVWGPKARGPQAEETQHAS